MRQISLHAVVCAVLGRAARKPTRKGVVRGGQRTLQPSRSTIALPCLTIEIMRRLPFITFEGSEGSGKSTQVRRLAARLERSGVAYLVTREPGGTPIGETIRELLQFASHNSGMTPQTELLLFEASRSQLVREIIKPALERGMCVIADRFFDSTTAYQGAARKLDREMVEGLNAFAVGTSIPDVTFVLDIDAASAKSRMQEPRRQDRMEQEPAEFYERVRGAYRELAAREPNRIVLINGARNADEIENEIWETLCKRFAALATNLQFAKTASPASDRDPHC
jgi:dTMP kinase